MDHIVLAVVDQKHIFFLSDGKIRAESLYQKLMVLEMRLVVHFWELFRSLPLESFLWSCDSGMSVDERSICHVAFHLNSNYLVTLEN